MKRNGTNIPATVGWVIVGGVAIGISTWSLYKFGTIINMPKLLALGISLSLDGGAIYTASISFEWARNKLGSAVYIRFCTLVFIGASITFNVAHAVLAGYPHIYRLFLAVPPIGALMVIEAHIRTLYRKQNRTKMPVFTVGYWLLFPIDTLRTIRTHMKAQLNAANGRVSDAQSIILPDANALREYAKHKGVSIKPTGPIPQFVKDMWAEEHTAPSMNGNS